MFSRLRKPLTGVAGLCVGVPLCWYVAGSTMMDKRDLKDMEDRKTVAGDTKVAPSAAWDWNWDRRVLTSNSLGKLFSTETPAENNSNTDDANVEAVQSEAARYIFMVHHGQYNIDGSTDEEQTLTALGKKQAQLAGERLMALRLPITRLVHSTLTRDTQTAEIMMKHMRKIETIETSDLIKKGTPVRCEPAVENIDFDLDSLNANDGARIEDAFKQLFHRLPATERKSSYEVIVCHSNVIGYFVCRALQIPPEAWQRVAFINGSITMLAISPDGRVNLRHLSDCGFMPANLITYN